MYKKALQQVVAAPIVGAAGGAALGTINEIGALAAYLASKDPTAKQIRGYQKDINKGSYAMPGQGKYRLIRKRIQLHNRLAKDKRNKSSLASQTFGGLAGTFALGLLGAAAGFALPYITKDEHTDPVETALVGAGIGAGAGVAGTLGGMLGAAFTKTRSTKDQTQYEKNINPGLNHWIPGVAAYNSAKTVGYMFNNKDYSKQLKGAK